MAYRIPDIDEPEELKVEHSSRFTLQPVEDEADEQQKKTFNTYILFLSERFIYHFND